MRQTRPARRRLPLLRRNVRIETRWTAGKTDEIRKYAAEFAALAPDVILAAATPIVGALQPATRTVPIVFVLVSDPVAAGFVDSLSRSRYRSRWQERLGL